MIKYIVRINEQPMNDTMFNTYIEALDVYTLLKKLKSINKVKIIKVAE